MAPGPGPERQNASPTTSSILERLDDYLSGPRWARITIGIVFVITTLVGGGISIRDAVNNYQEKVAKRSLENQSPYEGKGTYDPGQNKTSPEGDPKLQEEVDYAQHLDFHTKRQDSKRFITLSETLIIEYYPFDECLRWIRKDGRHGFLRQDRNQTAALSAQSEPRIATFATTGPNITESLLTSITPSGALTKLLIADRSSSSSNTDQNEPSNCLNPHPGNFKWSWGKAEDDCWVPVNREWPDGCHHEQRFNKCTGVWDPKIKWIKCVTPHSK